MIYPGEPPHVVDCPALRWDGEEVYCLETKTGDTDCWHDLCPYETGAWGAWRAVVIDILHRVAYEEGKIGYESWWPSVAIIRTELAAVGWSP